MSRRRAGRRSVSRGPKNNIWSVVLLESAAIGAGITEGDIVNASDMQAPLTGFQRYTLLRIRGWLAVSKAIGATADAGFMMIYVTDADSATDDPSVAATYTDEDILWTGGYEFSPFVVGALEPSQNVRIDIDVKSMRKIDTSRDVRFAFTQNLNGSTTVSGVLRALVRKGGN